jgi:large subunit ribosomal protein L10
MLRRKDKEKIVKELTENFKDSKSVIFANYKGVSVNDINDIRKKLRENEISYGVFKKSLIKIALKNAKIEGEMPENQAPIALAISKQDEVLPAKLLEELAKDFEALDLEGGILEKRCITKAEVKDLAKIPGREELIAKALGSIKAPISNFVGVLSGVPRQLVTVLKAIEEKKA